MLRLCLLCVLVQLASPGANAHHSFAIYSDQITEIEGELTRVRWGNPHVRFELEAADGTSWDLEAAAVYVLERRGLHAELFQLGDRLRIAGRRHRGGAAQIWLHNLQLSSGEELLMLTGVEPRWTDNTVGGDGSLAASEISSANRGIFRVWSRPELRPIAWGDNLPYLIERPTGGLEWIERLDGFAARCEPVGMPGIMATPYPFEFIDDGASIRLIGFSNNALIERTIYLNDNQDVTANRMGHSIGRWESPDTLVVETMQIDWPWFDDSLGTPQSDAMHSTETFILNTEVNRLDYEMTVSDPSLFTGSVTVIQNSWSALGETRAQTTFCTE